MPQLTKAERNTLNPQHTPGPWSLAVLTCIGGPAPCVTYDHGDVGGHIASLSCVPNAEANAAFIVAACNNHYELVEALEWFAEQRTIDEIISNPIEPEWAQVGLERRLELIGERKQANDAAIIRARTVVAKARGEA